MSLAVLNPLPSALAHYAAEIDAVVRAAGCDAATVPTPSAESAAGGSRVARAVRTLRSRRSLRSMDDDVLVVWPVFGLLDPLSYPRRTGRTWLVVHDPMPLRRQLGMGTLANRLGRSAVSGRMTVIVHSEPAQTALRERGWATVRLPHPVLPPTSSAGAGGQALRVLGQWKPARSMDALARLGAVAEWDGRREIYGRGWPEVPGWTVQSRFLSEAEMDERIGSAAAVVIPYDRYFQSGVAVRCLEQGVPAVGERHPFLAELYGDDWPGLVDGGDWAGAARRAADVPAAEIQLLHERYWSRCVEEWRALLSRVD